MAQLPAQMIQPAQEDYGSLCLWPSPSQSQTLLQQWKPEWGRQSPCKSSAVHRSRTAQSGSPDQQKFWWLAVIGKKLLINSSDKKKKTTMKWTKGLYWMSTYNISSAYYSHLFSDQFKYIQLRTKMQLYPILPMFSLAV